jgi:serine protease Do
MLRLPRIALAATALLLAAAASGCALDFRQVINRAKGEVFPVIVYVRPVSVRYEGGKRQEVQGIGSGVVVSPDGDVITNAHVAKDAVRITIVLQNEKLYNAEIVGLDQATDLALLKLDLGDDADPMPYARFGDSDQLEEGDFVMAMGNPGGLSCTLSFGVVSNTRRYLGDVAPYNLWIQTDAAINPGNSGGPLVNADGEIVGINTLKSRGMDSVGFAVPSNVVRRVYADLKLHKEVRRVWIGITLQALKDFDSNTFIDAEAGVMIGDVEPGSPAADAGLQAEDLLLQLNGVDTDGMFVEKLPALRTRLARLAPDEPATVRVAREGRLLDLTITPKLKGKIEGEDFDCKEWQMTIKEINRYATPQMHHFHKSGVYVQGVKPRGNARSGRLAPQDVIEEIAGEPIRSLDDAKRVYAELDKRPKDKRQVLVKVFRSGTAQWLVLDYRKRDQEYEEEK